MGKTLVICVIYLALSLVGMTLIKYGHQVKSNLVIPVLNINISWPLIFGMLFYGCSFLVFVFFVSTLKISIVMPIVSGVAGVLTVLIGCCIFSEKISVGQLIGITLVLTGTMIIGIFKN